MEKDPFSSGQVAMVVDNTILVLAMVISLPSILYDQKFCNLLSNLTCFSFDRLLSVQQQNMAINPGISKNVQRL